VTQTQNPPPTQQQPMSKPPLQIEINRTTSDSAQPPTSQTSNPNCGSTATKKESLVERRGESQIEKLENWNKIRLVSFKDCFSMIYF